MKAGVMVVVKDTHQGNSWLRRSCNHVSSRESRIADSHIRRSSCATPSSHQASSQTSTLNRAHVGRTALLSFSSRLESFVLAVAFA